MFSIIGESNVRTFTKESNFKQVYHYACLSTDTPPTTGISNGSTCIEMNTGKKYIFDEENGEWEELPSSGGGGGGGGGGGDITTAEITFHATAGEGYNVDFIGLARCTLGLSAGDGDEPYICEYAGAVNDKVTIYLYNGAGHFLTITGYDNTQQTILSPAQAPTFSGGIRYDEEEDNYIVTGDGTITVEMSPE